MRSAKRLNFGEFKEGGKVQLEDNQIGISGVWLIDPWIGVYPFVSSFQDLANPCYFSTYFNSSSSSGFFGLDLLSVNLVVFWGLSKSAIITDAIDR